MPSVACPSCERRFSVRPESLPILTQCPQCRVCFYPDTGEIVDPATRADRASTQPRQPPPSPVRPDTVQVSARLLSWPQSCACCRGSSTATLAASHTRTTGKKVIHSQTRSWNVPYCDDCKEHVRLYEDAKSSLLLGILAGALVPFCVFALFIDDENNLYRIAGVLGILAGLALLPLSYRNYQRKMSLARESQNDDCCALWAAVEYHGWYGTVHTFVFYNQAYATAFRSLNARKCVGG